MYDLDTYRRNLLEAGKKVLSTASSATVRSCTEVSAVHCKIELKYSDLLGCRAPEISSGRFCNLWTGVQSLLRRQARS
jgi:hypothetical protein